MLSQPDIENDPFLTLLTDALRAGPGSPAWHDAVARLKTPGQAVDEYALLIEAREALESGKEYRSVRAGPGFTRKLLGNIEEEKQRSRAPRISPASLIAILSAAVIIVVAAILAWQLRPHAPVNPVQPNSKAIDDLAHTFFAGESLAADFDSGIPMTWRKIGELPLQASGGLHPAPGATPSSSGYVGGGLVSAEPVAGDQQVSVQVAVKLVKPGDDLVAQVFVSNSPEFSDRATAPHEVVWSLHERLQRAVVNSAVEASAPAPATGRDVLVRLILNRDLAIIEADGKRLWAGPNRLGDQPRYIGVRFIRTEGAHPADVSFRSIRVSTAR